MRTLQFIEFQHAVMTMLLAGDHPALATLRLQYDMSQVETTEFTGAGFYTYFHVPGTVVPLTEVPRFLIDDVCGDIDGVTHGITFVLHGRDGVIQMLEGVTYVGPWPESVGRYSLKYMYVGRRIDEFGINPDKG